MNKQILIVDEVAKLLRVDKQRVYELVRTNQIPVIRLGKRQYRFSADEINHWLENGGESTVICPFCFEEREQGEILWQGAVPCVCSKCLKESPKLIAEINKNWREK